MTTVFTDLPPPPRSPLSEIPLMAIGHTKRHAAVAIIVLGHGLIDLVSARPRAELHQLPRADPSGHHDHLGFRNHYGGFEQLPATDYRFVGGPGAAVSRGATWHPVEIRL